MTISSTLPIDTTLQNDKYRIVRVLGQGGFGITYLAFDESLQKRVAIKEFFPTFCCMRDNANNIIPNNENHIETIEKLKKRFRKEAINNAQLKHPGIVEIHNIFDENGSIYYAMDYIDGSSLSQIIKEKGAMPEDKAIKLIQKVAEAVDSMHSLHMNHLDIKPANIMMRMVDNAPVLIDFGLSKQFDLGDFDVSMMPMGYSPGFSALERYEEGISSFTPQTDIYSLAATLYNLLTGEKAPSAPSIKKHGLPELPPPISDPTKKR